GDVGQHPLHVEPVALISRVTTAEDAVAVDGVAGDPGAEHREEEVRVARDERIEGPGDATDLARESPLALVLLELATPSAAAVLRQQRGDVRVHGALARLAEESDRGADHALFSALVVE